MPELRSVPFFAFAREVEDLYREPHKRKPTLRKVRQVLREVGPLCPHTDQMSPATIARWLSSAPPRQPMTRKSLLGTLRAICMYGAFRHYMDDPFTFRSLSHWCPADELEEVQEFRKHRSAEEIGRVLARADQESEGGGWEETRLRALIYLWAFTGAGTREALGLRWIDFDFNERIVKVRSHPRRRLKTGARAAVLPLAPPVMERLLDWRALESRCEWAFPHKYLTGPWLNGRPGRRPLDRVKSLGERAGVPGLTILAFRHSFGTLSEDWGIGELMLQRILRHSRPTTQKNYRHADAELLHRAAAKVRFDLNG